LRVMPLYIITIIIQPNHYFLVPLLHIDSQGKIMVVHSKGCCQFRIEKIHNAEHQICLCDKDRHLVDNNKNEITRYSNIAL